MLAVVVAPALQSAQGPALQPAVSVAASALPAREARLPVVPETVQPTAVASSYQCGLSVPGWPVASQAAAARLATGASFRAELPAVDAVAVSAAVSLVRPIRSPVVIPAWAAESLRSVAAD